MQTKDNPLEAWAKSAHRKLVAGYEQTNDLVDHKGLIGAIREFVAKDVLETILPLSVEIGTGQIIDAQKHLSNQIDLAITRSNAPAFRFSGGLKTYFLETVLATIEVKSIINKEGLFLGLDNCLSVKKLQLQLNSLRSKGFYVFTESFEWVDSIGGVDRLDKLLIEPSQENSAYCPIDVWKVIRFVLYWLHWERGDFADSNSRNTFESIFAIDADYTFFFELLFYYLEETDFDKGMRRFKEAPAIKEEFLKGLYAHIAQDEILPYTYIFAYQGYDEPESLAKATREWFEKNRKETSWTMMPKVILNQKVLMYRTFNTYHCSHYEYPLLFLMTSLVNALSEDINFDSSYGLSTGLQAYFDPTWLREKHPRNSPSYLFWRIPLDNSSAGEFKRLGAPKSNP